MKVLWIVNTIFPYVANKMNMQISPYGGWLKSLYEGLISETDISMVICSTYDGRELKHFSDGRTSYYLIPDKNPEKYNEKLIKYWKEINRKEKPDVVHIHGTEYPRGLSFVNSNIKVPTVISIQGLIYRYAKVIYGNLNYSQLIKNITFRDMLKPRTGILSHISANKRGEYEKELLAKSKNIIGRTTWDKSIPLALNPKLRYFHGDESLREPFYNNKWNIEEVKRNSIFIIQSQTPLKGFHMFLEALKILKSKYPDILVKIAGNNIFDQSTLKKKLKRQSYTKYLQKQIEKYDLADNIKFTGFLNESQMVQELKSTHVYVQTSAIENSSNALCEAMILGMPCVASNVGGTSDMLEHNKEGFLYPYTETDLLAYYISEFFENDDLCDKCGKEARKRALKRHNLNNNVKNTIAIYKELINNEAKK